MVSLENKKTDFINDFIKNQFEPVMLQCYQYLSDYINNNKEAIYADFRNNFISVYTKLISEQPATAYINYALLLSDLLGEKCTATFLPMLYDERLNLITYGYTYAYQADWLHNHFAKAYEDLRKGFRIWKRTFF